MPKKGKQEETSSRKRKDKDVKLLSLHSKNVRSAANDDEDERTKI